MSGVGWRGAWLGILTLLVAPPRAPAAVRADEEPDSVQQGSIVVEVRVIGVLDPVRVRIDKGRADGLLEGDEVVLVDRQGGVLLTRAVQVSGRSTIVEIQGGAGRVELGMGGEAVVPMDRLTPAALPKAREHNEPTPPAPPELADGPAVPPEYENTDEHWRDGMPLLAGLAVPRPEDRAPRLRGELWSSFDAIDTGEPGRSDTFLRGGLRARIDNLFRDGGTWNADLEWNQRRTLRVDENDLEDQTFRVERFSYRWGGHRFATESWEVGRFLQSGMPQFGVLDGVEWSHREPGANSFGASLGWMPEPNRDFESGHDLQLALWYRWVSDPTELFRAAIGYQKTWHDGAADRDLIVLDGHYLPVDGWRWFWTLWVDWYTGGDDPKRSGPNLTQAMVSASRDFADVASVSVVYTHLEYPFTERDEFTPPGLVDELFDEAVDRLGVDTWIRASEETRVLTRLGAWADREDEGVDGELAAELSGVFGSSSRLRSGVFGSDAAFTSVVGARIGVGRVLERSQWELSYELSNQRQKGFSSDNDDYRQQRLRLSGGWRPTPFLSLNAHVDTVLRDDISGYAAGVYAQWNF